MKKVYAIKDTKGASFDAPFIADVDAIAVRNVKTVVNGQKGSLLAQYPEDFELWLIGEYDERTGLLKPVELTMIVACAALVNVQDA